MLKDLLSPQLTNHPCCVSQDASVREVAQLMKKEDVGCVLVTRGSTRIPIGIITDRDLATRCLADSLSPDQATAREIMTPNVRTVREDAGLYECIRTMNEAGIRRVPVVDASGNAIGVLSFGDILRLLSGELGALVENCTTSSTDTKPQKISQNMAKSA